jgi:TatD family-associated radical SAM protein
MQLVYDIEDRRYINLTDRCTLRCAFCPKFNGSHRVHDYDLTLPQRPEPEEILAQLGNPREVREVVFCGFGEPTLRLKVLLMLAAEIRQLGGRVRLNTDGLGNLVHRRNILPELARCVDALSISLNAQEEAIYQRHCRPQLPGSYAAVREFVALAPNFIPDCTITAINGLVGVDIDACRAIAEDAGARFRARELDVVG